VAEPVAPWQVQRKPSPPAWPPAGNRPARQPPAWEPAPPWKAAQTNAWDAPKPAWGASKPAWDDAKPSSMDSWEPKRPVNPKPFQRVFLQSERGDPQQIQLLRDELKVSVEGAEVQACAPIRSFGELGVLPDYVMRVLAETGRDTPMPIQAQALPIILGGHDLIGIAKTGSGKTLAFLLPAIVHMEAQRELAKEDATPIVLIVAPTRELVQQIADEAGKLLEHSTEGNHKTRGIWAQEVYGGKQRNQQLAKAHGAALIAATPGRLSDFISSGDLSLDRITYFALDEADRMLDMGFQGDIEKFSSCIREDRHTVFFSATWPKHVQELATDLCQSFKQPMILKVGQRDDGAQATRSDIKQEVVVFDQPDWTEREFVKKALLYGHLRQTLKVEGNKVLVFVGSKTLADELAETLGKEGFSTDSMHGGRKQWDRDEVLARFKRDEFKLLIATDVMGRGLDIPTITHVVVYDMGDIDDYVHRIGRTARGNSDLPGHALTLFEYNKKWPELAGLLVKVLDSSGQEAPEDLRRIADEVEAGERQMVDRHVEGPKKPTKAAMARIGAMARQYDAAGKPICNFFLEGCCTKGDWCEYSHPGETGADTKATGGSSTPCKFFKETGSCKKGDQCWYSHA